MKNILFWIVSASLFLTFPVMAEEIKEAPVVSDSVISEITEIEYQEPLTAMTVPAEINNYTYVNLREDANINCNILGMSEMYKNLKIYGEKADFYKVEVTCTDNGTKIGYIAKQYVKAYSHQGTGYINLKGEYDYSYSPLYRYPDSSSSRLIKLSPYTNVYTVYSRQLALLRNKRQLWFHCQKQSYRWLLYNKTTYHRTKRNSRQYR